MGEESRAVIQRDALTEEAVGEFQIVGKIWPSATGSMWEEGGHKVFTPEMSGL